MDKSLLHYRIKANRSKRKVEWSQKYNSYRGLLLLMYDMGFLKAGFVRDAIDRVDIAEVRDWNHMEGKL